VPFEEFKARLFEPLEHIVQADFDAGYSGPQNSDQAIS
jgi:hypothetical protein